MMICPQTKQECQLGCQNPRDCQLQLAPYEFCAGENSQAVSIHGDGVLSIDPSVTSFSAQPTAFGWALERVYKTGIDMASTENTKFIALDNGDIIEYDTSQLVAIKVADVAGNVAPFVMRDLTTPPPTLAEIERLVSKYEEAVYHLGYEQLRKGADTQSWTKFRDEANAARAALLSAIQKLTQ